MREFERRQDVWCEKTGLIRSSGRIKRAFSNLNRFNFLEKANYPDFDHSHLYYHQKERVYVLMTEPYHSTEGAVNLLEGFNTNLVIRSDYIASEKGLWNPGGCFALLIGPPGTYKLLEFLESHLPQLGEN